MKWFVRVETANGSHSGQKEGSQMPFYKFAGEMWLSVKIQSDKFPTSADRSTYASQRGASGFSLTLSAFLFLLAG